MKARNARQHATTKIVWAVNGEQQDAEQFAAQNGVVAKRARLQGQVVWCAKVGEITTVFLFPETGLKIGLCMYRWCTRKRGECGYHTGRPL